MACLAPAASWLASANCAQTHTMAHELPIERLTMDLASASAAPRARCAALSAAAARASAAAAADSSRLPSWCIRFSSACKCK